MRPFRHRALLEPRDGEAGGCLSVLGADGAGEARHGPHGPAGRRQRLMHRFHIRDRERRKVDAGSPRERCLELHAERRVGRVDKELEVAGLQHDADIAGAGERGFARLGVGDHLRAVGRHREACRRQRLGARLGIGDEVADMIQYDFAFAGQVLRRLAHIRSNSSVIPGHARLLCSLFTNQVCNAFQPV